MTLKAPFPWFGGKSRVAPLVWEHFGDVRNFVEPFFGSGAVLLGRPGPFEGTETINDKDGLVANFWRAVQHDPDAVAKWVDNPVNEADLHARHVWLLEKMGPLCDRLMGDPDYFDARVAGYWCWGLCCWIGAGWCSGKGCWGVGVDEEGFRKLVHLGNAGQGVNRKLVHLGNTGQGVHRKLVHLGNTGQGVHRKLVHLVGPSGNGIQTTKVGESLYEWFRALADRLRRVRVCCGDWSRIMGPTPTVKHGLTAVFLDPPYAAEAGRDEDLYREESGCVAHEVRQWCLENGDNPKLRIALCGYEGEHAMPDSWQRVSWKAKGGYGALGNGRGRTNAGRERIWFSPHCLTGQEGCPSEQGTFFST